MKDKRKQPTVGKEIGLNLAKAEISLELAAH